MNQGDSWLNCALQLRYTTACISEELKKMAYFMVIYKIINKQIFIINVDREKEVSMEEIIRKG